MRRAFLLFLAMAAGGCFAQSAAPTLADVENARKIWLAIKHELTGLNGIQFFENTLKDADVPRLTGTLVDASQPRLLKVAVEDGSTIEIELRVTGEQKEPPVPRGFMVAFRGVPVAFQREPFLLTMEVKTVAMFDPPVK